MNAIDTNFRPIQNQKSVEDVAAIKIQKTWKRFCLNLQKARDYIASPPTLSRMMTASRGKTPVYLPKGLPLVIKQCGSPQNLARLEKMRQAQLICKEKQFSHLIIPHARIEKECLIEGKLPIKYSSTKGQLALYLNRQEEFKAAAIEFTKFLLQYRVHVLTTDHYSGIYNVPNARYDNCTLYLQNGVGKIGMVDLERFDPAVEMTRELKIKACLTSLTFFPCHVQDIWNAALELDPTLADGKPILEKREKGLSKWINLFIYKHVEFVKTQEDPFSAPSVFDEIDYDLSKILETKTIDIFYSNSIYDRILIKGDAEVKRIAKKLTVEIFDLFKTQVQSLWMKIDPQNSEEVLVARTLFFDRKLFGALIHKLTTELSIRGYILNSLIPEIAIEICRELEEQKKIAAFHQNVTLTEPISYGLFL